MYVTWRPHSFVSSCFQYNNNNENNDIFDIMWVFNPNFQSIVQLIIKLSIPTYLLFNYLSITGYAAPISPSWIVLHLNGRRNSRNHSPMAASGFRPSIRSRIPQSVSARERGSDWHWSGLGQDIHHRSKITSGHSCDFELHLEKSSVGKQPSIKRLSILGLAQRGKGRFKLFVADLRVQNKVGQV